MHNLYKRFTACGGERPTTHPVARPPLPAAAASWHRWTPRFGRSSPGRPCTRRPPSKAKHGDEGAAGAARAETDAGAGAGAGDD